MLDKKNYAPKEYIDCVLDASQKQVFTVFGNCTVVAVKLANGFVVVESSGCIDPKNYSEEIGTEICMKQIRKKIWLLEGYVCANEFMCNNVGFTNG